MKIRVNKKVDIKYPLEGKAEEIIGDFDGSIEEFLDLTHIHSFYKITIAFTFLPIELKEIILLDQTLMAVMDAKRHGYDPKNDADAHAFYSKHPELYDYMIQDSIESMIYLVQNPT
jgi:hypothetical protein